MGRGVHRGVYGALFDDPDYQTLSPSARLVLLTARQCAQAGPGSIFRYYPEILARQTGLSRSRVLSGLEELAYNPAPDRPWVVYGKAIIWVRNGLRHDPSINYKTNPKHRAAVLRAVAGLPHDEIVLKFCQYYDLPMPFDSHSIGEPMLDSPNTEEDRKRPKKTEEEIAIPPPPQIVFRIPESVTTALDKAPQLGQNKRLRDPVWWQAQVRAYGGVNFAAVILKAEAYLATVGIHRYRDKARFLLNQIKWEAENGVSHER